MDTPSNTSNTVGNLSIEVDELGNLSPTADELARMRKEYRLGWHPRGGWCRRMPGDANRTYFGKVAPAAVKAMHAEEQRRKRGEKAEVRRDNLAVKDAVNAFLTHLDDELAKGEIGSAQRASYGDEIDKFISQVGKDRRLSDFCRMDAPEAIFKPLRSAALKRGVFATEKHVTQIRTFFRWASDVRRLMPAPFYADAFSPPSLKEKQRHIKSERRERGERGTARWTTAEVREIVQAASEDVHRYAQVLLMLNGGMGATDLSNLRDSEINWDTKIIDTDRSKTQVPRIVPLWDKTIAAMKISRANRAAPADKKFADRFFLTPHGQPLVIEQFAEGDEKRIKVKRTDALKNWFYQLLNGSQREKWKKKAIRLPHLKVHGGGVYTLRSVFVNLSTGHGQGQDENLVASILGWKTSNEIMQWYLRGDNSAKQRAIVEHVRKQIWPEEV